MSSESTSGASVSSGSSSDVSGSESHTNSQSASERMGALLPNTQGDYVMPAHAARSARGPSHDIDAEETDADVEIVEEGEEGETPGPIPAAAKGQPVLTLATYRLGRSCVTEAELDKYVTQGLIKPTLHGLCRALG
jgi:hypothetical protein